VNRDSAPHKMPLDYFARAQIVRKPLFLDGYTRSGKFLLGSLLDSLENTEYIQNPWFLETSLYLYKLGKIDFKTLKILIQTDLDFNTYNMAIGRNLNSRKSDESSIHNSIKVKEFLSRSEFPDQTTLFERFQNGNLLPLYITHEALCNVAVLFDVYPEMRMISAQRNPVSLVKSWRDRGWGSRWGNDPKSFSIAFDERGKAIPWFALEWGDEYWNLNEIERIVKSLHSLSKKAEREYKALNSENKSKILFVDFDNLLNSPQGEVERVADYLDCKILAGLELTMKRQKLPREKGFTRIEQIRLEIVSVLSSNIRNLYDELVEDYNNFWLPMTQTLKSM